MSLRLERDEDEGERPHRGEVIGRVIPRTTLRPVNERDEHATDEELANLLRRTDPRTDGDAPSVERVRTSPLDAIGTAAEPSNDAPDAAPEARARAIVEELQKCGPGDEQAYLEPLRHLGPRALAVLAEGFPGLLWFDRRLPHRKTPRGRDASPMCSLLVGLGEAASPAVVALLESPSPVSRYYAALVAADLGIASLVVPLAGRVFDEDSDVREVALTGLSELARRAEEPPALAAATTRALDEAAARFRLKLRAQDCTAFERTYALSAVRALCDAQAVSLLVPFVAWVEPEVAAIAREALSRITAEDFGTDASAWQKWMRKHAGERRVEWLVAALGGARAEMRAYAHAELVRILGGDFGYAVDLGPLDRIVAQRRARKLARARGLLA